MWLCTFLLCFILHGCVSQITYINKTENDFHIVGLFHRSDTLQQLAFTESMKHAHHGSARLHPIVIESTGSDSYAVWREMCINKMMRPIAILGPQNIISDGAVRNQCFLANIPHIQATWQPVDPELELDEEELEEITDDQGPTYKKISINFYPDSDQVALVYGQILKRYKWENFAVLYEDNFGLLRVQKILAEHTDRFSVLMRKLEPGGDNRKIFKELKLYREDRIIMDCHADNILKYMDEAASFQNLNDYQHFLLVTLDASVVAGQLSKLPANFTWLSITDYGKLNDAQHYLAPRVGLWLEDGQESKAVVEIKTEAVIMDDVANHIVKSLENVENIERHRPRVSVCDQRGRPWIYGALLQDQILKTQTTGLTGNIEFDEQGKRINYELFLNEIYSTNRKTVAKWDSTKEAFQDLNTGTETVAIQQSSKHFYVIAKVSEPYFYRNESCDPSECIPEGPAQYYEGFSVDLVKAIFKILKQDNFNYTFSFREPDPKKNYGHFDKNTKKWDGLIGDLLNKDADLAVCDLTITEERKKVVDFSVPFMTLGISILAHQEPEVSPEMFSFLNPYTVDVWMYTATAYCIVSMVLFVCARISPADWENPEPCEKDPEELENIWTFKNCAWLTMGSIMCQGCDILPKAFGTRWVCSMWWFFAVIVCQTYIAQLSASMTSAAESEPINSVEDLAKQSKMMYGAIDGGSTLEFFKSSKDKTFQRMYETMNNNRALLARTNDEGEKRVVTAKTRYAFLMESCAIEYKLKRNCNLKKVGGELDSKDYGIAMPANSPFRSDINRAILRLKESTVLEDIKKKWWDQRNNAKSCDSTTVTKDFEGDLEMDHLKGAFIVLIGGLVICIFISAAEFMNEVRNIVVREQVSHKEVIIKELKSSLNFFQLQKPVLRNPSRAASIMGSSNSGEQEDKIEKRSNVVDNFLDFEKEKQ